MKKKQQPTKDSENARTYALNRAIRYLTVRSRSVKEVNDYLVQKNYAEDTISYALKRLVDLKFLNDSEFGEQWIHSRQKYKGKSKFILKRELKDKGLDEEKIDLLLANANDDLEIAKKLFEKKKDKIKAKNQYDFRNKMGAYLARRGFSWEIIRKVINEKD